MGNPRVIITAMICIAAITVSAIIATTCEGGWKTGECYLTTEWRTGWEWHFIMWKCTHHQFKEVAGHLTIWVVVDSIWAYGAMNEAVPRTPETFYPFVRYFTHEEIKWFDTKRELPGGLE